MNFSGEIAIQAYTWNFGSTIYTPYTPATVIAVNEKNKISNMTKCALNAAKYVLKVARLKRKWNIKLDQNCKRSELETRFQRKRKENKNRLQDKIFWPMRLYVCVCATCWFRFRCGQRNKNHDSVQMKRASLNWSVKSPWRQYTVANTSNWIWFKMKQREKNTGVRDGGKATATLSAVVDGLSVCKTRSWPEN